MVASTLANVTITVPEDLKRVMRRFKNINWSSVARAAFQEAIRREEQREADQGIDKLRADTRAKGWSGAEEIRRWRDQTR